MAVRRKSSVRAVSYPRILEFHPPESLNPYPVSAALLTRNMAAPPSSSASSSLPSSSSSSSSSSLSQSTSCTPPTEDRLATPRRITLANIPSPLLTLPPVAALIGATIGMSRGGSRARLRFLAENAHRQPRTVQGWVGPTLLH